MIDKTFLPLWNRVLFGRVLPERGESYVKIVKHTFHCFYRKELDGRILHAHAASFSRRRVLWKDLFLLCSENIK